MHVPIRMHRFVHGSGWNDRITRRYRRPLGERVLHRAHDGRRSANRGFARKSRAVLRWRTNDIDRDRRHVLNSHRQPRLSGLRIGRPAKYTAVPDTRRPEWPSRHLVRTRGRRNVLSNIASRLGRAVKRETRGRRPRVSLLSYASRV